MDAKITPTELRNNRLSITDTEDVTETVVDFLVTHMMTKEELLSLIKQYKGGKSVTVTQSINQLVETAKTKVEKVIDSYESGSKLNIIDPFLAESLVKKYGFKCIEVIEGTKVKPKTWVLTRT